MSLAKRLAEDVIRRSASPTSAPLQLDEVEYTLLMDNFSALQLHLNEPFRKEFVTALSRRFDKIAVAQTEEDRGNYFPSLVRGPADYFIAADTSSKQAYAITLAFSKNPISLRRIAV